MRKMCVFMTSVNIFHHNINLPDSLRYDAVNVNYFNECTSNYSRIIPYILYDCNDDFQTDVNHFIICFSLRISSSVSL